MIFSHGCLLQLFFERFCVFNRRAVLSIRAERRRNMDFEARLMLCLPFYRTKMIVTRFGRPFSIHVLLPTDFRRSACLRRPQCQSCALRDPERVEGEWRIIHVCLATRVGELVHLAVVGLLLTIPCCTEVKVVPDDQSR